MIQDVVSFSDSLCSGKCVRCRIILPLYYFLVSVCQSLLCLLVWSWLFAVTHGRLADCGGARGRCCVVALSAARGRARRGPASRPAEAVGSPWPSPRASSSTDTPLRLCWTGRFALPWAVRSAPPPAQTPFSTRPTPITSSSTPLQLRLPARALGSLLVSCSPWGPAQAPRAEALQRVLGRREGRTGETQAVGTERGAAVRARAGCPGLGTSRDGARPAPAAVPLQQLRPGHCWQQARLLTLPGKCSLLVML